MICDINWYLCNTEIWHNETWKEQGNEWISLRKPLDLQSNHKNANANANADHWITGLLAAVGGRGLWSTRCAEACIHGTSGRAGAGVGDAWICLLCHAVVWVSISLIALGTDCICGRRSTRVGCFRCCTTRSPAPGRGMIRRWRGEEGREGGAVQRFGRCFWV